jgi:hypothetical protein
MEGILKASYGDRDQRSANQKGKDADAARRVELAWRERRAAQPRAEVRALCSIEGCHCAGPVVVAERARG